MIKAAAFAVALGLAGCADHGKCLESHPEWQLIPQYFYINGRMQLLYLQPILTESCDKWEFPEGRK